MNSLTKRLSTHWQIFWLLRQMHLQRSFEYRANFWFWAGVSLMWTVFNFFFFDLIVGVSGTIGGWSRYEMYVLLSIFTMLDAVVWSFFYNNMATYTQSIFSGELSQVLTKPINPQFMIMIQNNNYTNIFRFVLGAGMLGWSLHQLRLDITLGQVIGFVIAFSCSLLFTYAVWFTLSTLAFWVDKLDNINEILPAARRLWEVPRSIYTGVLSTVLTVLIPLGLVSSLPAELLLGKSGWQWLSYFALATLIALWLSHQFFQFSIKKFTGVAN